VNTDMRVDADWLTELVCPIQSREADCTTSLMLSWNRQVVNFGGSAMNFHGIGWQVGIDDTDIDRYRRPGETLFACGGSMAVRRDVFTDAGGFDNDFFAYYEDVDLGFRLWVLGYRVLYAPRSIAYHHHKATSRRIDVHKIRLLQTRNPLWLIYKNYEAATLARILPAALLVHQKRTALMMRTHVGEYRIGGTDGHHGGTVVELLLKVRAARRSVAISPLVTADLLAIDDFSTRLESMAEKRRTIQSRRKRSDADIVKLFRIPFWAVNPDPDFVAMFHAVIEAFQLREVFGAHDIVTDPQAALNS
jgi:hypothetical protein